MKTWNLPNHHDIGKNAQITPTGDDDIDQYADKDGTIINARAVRDGDAGYIQVCVKIGNAEIWVNDDEYQLV